ncbi:GIY-YIG nuclease family protein [Carboxylicivirga sp. N1Y90]|uniref:GIY-YIG nuclease family protein n=1 Tax=Carboxylicivirga fragile TaxID=3417571 RepID=UPI003D355EB7|nr:GIY-YIG nuclease family protein [Marinilabiliaceae bacterium N1Y90]
MNYYTYILYSPHFNKFYYGQSQNLKTRLEKHNNGQVQSTNRYKPWVIYAYKELKSRPEAIAFEKKLKNLKARKRLMPFLLLHGFTIITINT